MRSDCEIRTLVFQQLSAAAESVRAAGSCIERGQDCVRVLRELAEVRAQLDEVRRLLAAHEANSCLDVLAGSECVDDMQRASERFTRLCTD